MNNGRYWNAIDGPEAQSAYLAGVLDGWFLGMANEDGVKGKYLNIFSRGRGGPFSTADLANMLTSIYRDAENLNLPIKWIAMASFAIVRGETSRESVLPALRRYLGSQTPGPDGSTPLPPTPVDVINAARLK
jgi:hypothetical protein